MDGYSFLLELGTGHIFLYHPLYLVRNWKGPNELFKEMVDAVLGIQPTIKLRASTDFLDVTVTKNNGKICTNLYSKPTKGNNLLQTVSKDATSKRNNSSAHQESLPLM